MDVVLVHAALTGAGEWDGVRPALERAGHRVVSPDLPGYGDRPLDPGELSLGEFVLGLEFSQAALVGTSFGSRAVLEAALVAPERVTALGLVSPNPFGWDDEVQRLGTQEEELFDGGRFEEAADLMVRSWVDGPQRGPDVVPAALRARVHAMQKRAYELQRDGDAGVRRLEIEPARVQCPTLVVRGALDWPEVARASARLAAEIPHARELVYDDCAHLPAMEQPDRLARDLVAFLAAVA